MSKKRYINTKFWDDNYIINLDPIEKLLFLYFLTNPLTDICGVYEIPLRRISFDTGIDKDMVLRILERFTADRKVFYLKNSWIYVKNFAKHQAVNDSVKKGIERSMQDVPMEICLIINEFEQTDTDCGRLSPDCDLPILKLTPTLKPTLTPKLKEREAEASPSQVAKTFFNDVDEQERIIDLLEAKGYNRTIVVREVVKFVSYWTEKNKSGSKERYEMEKTFEVGKRLATWFSRVKDFSGQANKGKEIIF